MNDPGQRVTVVNIDIPFTRLVWIFIKWGIAAVPATITIGATVTTDRSELSADGFTMRRRGYPKNPLVGQHRPQCGRRRASLEAGTSLGQPSAGE